VQKWPESFRLDSAAASRNNFKGYCNRNARNHKVEPTINNKTPLSEAAFFWIFQSKILTEIK
jgi:hypothetical protein